MLARRGDADWEPALPSPSLLGGSWLVISRVISRITTVITHIKRLITPLITTHEPPSDGQHLCLSGSCGSGPKLKTLFASQRPNCFGKPGI